MSSHALQKIVREFRRKRVLVVGDVMLDEYVWGDAHRISPEAPVPVLEVVRRTLAPGGAANVAANVACLGGQAILGGVIGSDREAGWLTEVLKGVGVEADGLGIDTTRPTTTKTRIVARAQQIVRMDRESNTPLPRLLEDQILTWCKKEMATAHACILSDYAKGVVSQRFAQELIHVAKQNSIPVIVDPKGSDYGKYCGAAVIKPNSFDVQQVLGRKVSGDADWQLVGERLMEMLPGTALIISRGPDGMTLFRHGYKPCHIPSAARTIFDVTGAGDTVVATVALAVASQASLEESVQLANRCAGIAVAKLGTAAVTMKELLSRLRARRTTRPAAPGARFPQANVESIPVAK